MGTGCFFRRMCQLRRRFSQAPELPFAQVLCEAGIRSALSEEGFSFRDCIYLPWVTLWVFLSQVLSADHSCRDAVARFLAPAHGPWLEALLDEHRSVLHGAAATSRIAGRATGGANGRTTPGADAA